MGRNLTNARRLGTICALERVLLSGCHFGRGPWEGRIVFLHADNGQIVSSARTLGLSLTGFADRCFSNRRNLPTNTFEDPNIQQRPRLRLQ